MRVMLRKNLKLGLVFSAEGCNISSCVLRAPQIAGWSSLVARRAHNPEAVGSNPAPATKFSGTHSGAFLISAGQTGDICNPPWPALIDSTVPPVMAMTPPHQGAVLCLGM